MVILLCGCTAAPLNPLPNDRFGSVGQAGFERDAAGCRKKAAEEGHDTGLKPRDLLFPFLLAAGGAALGAQQEYGSPLHPSDEAYYGGQLLIGMAVGGFVAGAAISALSWSSRQRAHETFIRECLLQRGYEFPS